MAFRPTPKFEAELREDPQYLRGLRELAQPAREAAEQASFHREPIYPVGRPHFTVDIVGDEVRLVNNDRGWAIDEFAAPSRNHPAAAPLRRGVRAAGMRLAEESARD